MSLPAPFASAAQVQPARADSARCAPRPRNFGATDCPKNAHLIPEWENLEEEVELLRRANATSIIDEGDLAALMRVADLSNRDFSAHRQNTRVVMGGPIVIEDQAAKQELPAHMKNLPIPKRPAWNKKMAKEQVDHNEKEAFLTWRRGFVEMEENYDIAMTPFEKNIEFWRQLWRVVEKSDVVVQVVDARNPLLYLSEVGGCDLARRLSLPCLPSPSPSLPPSGPRARSLVRLLVADWTPPLLRACAVASRVCDRGGRAQDQCHPLQQGGSAAEKGA